MRSIFLGVILSIVVLPPLPGVEDDSSGCSAVESEFNGLKERIALDFSINSRESRSDLVEVNAKLEGYTVSCSSSPILPEVWAYSVRVLERLNTGTPKWRNELRHARDVRDKLSYESLIFNPAKSDVTAAEIPRPPRPVRRKWALTVGINEFVDQHVPGLQFAAKDASDFADFLEDSKGGGFQSNRVRRLINNQATSMKIKEGIGWLRSNVLEDDLVVLFFSSHGSPRKSDPNGVSYIVTHDTNTADSASLYATSIQMVDLVLTVTREIKARRVVLILDTCYSGDAQSKSGERSIVPVYSSEVTAPAPFSSALTGFGAGYGRAVLTASRGDEISRESAGLDGGNGNGYFTRFLIDALRQPTSKLAGTSPMSLAEAFEVVQARVSSAVKTQHPTALFSDHGGEIVLGVPES